MCMLWCYNPLAGLWYPSQPSTARARMEDGRSITHVHTHLPTQTACATRKTCLRSAPSVATMLGTCTCAYVCTCWCASASIVTVCHVWEGQVPAFLAMLQWPAYLLSVCSVCMRAMFYITFAQYTGQYMWKEAMQMGAEKCTGRMGGFTRSHRSEPKRKMPTSTSVFLISPQCTLKARLKCCSAKLAQDRYRRQKVSKIQPLGHTPHISTPKP